MNLLNPTWESIKQINSSFFSKIYDHKYLHGINIQLILTYHGHYSIYARNDKRESVNFSIESSPCHLRSLNIFHINGLVNGYNDYDKQVYYLNAHSKPYNILPDINITDAVIHTVDYSCFMGNINSDERKKYRYICIGLKEKGLIL